MSFNINNFNNVYNVFNSDWLELPAAGSYQVMMPPTARLVSHVSYPQYPLCPQHSLVPQYLHPLPHIFSDNTLNANRPMVRATQLHQNGYAMNLRPVHPISYLQQPLVPQHLRPFLHTFSDTADRFQQAVSREKRKEREDDSLDLAKRTKPIERQNTFSSTANKAISPIRDQPPSSPKGRLQKSSTRTCSSCSEEKTAVKWYKNPTTGLVDRCKACYNRSREGKTQNCSSCGEEKTTKQWLKDPITGLSDRCQTCYRKAKRKPENTISLQ